MMPKDGLSSAPPGRQPLMMVVALMLPILLYAAGDLLTGPLCISIRRVMPPTGVIIAWYWFSPAIAPLLGVPGIILLKRKAFVLQVLLTGAIWALDLWSCVRLFLG